jgi:uncharacterized protein
MRLELENLENDGAFARGYEPDELSLEVEDVRLAERVEVNGRGRRTSDAIQVSGALKTKVETPCARCLKPVVVPIATQFSERFVTAVSWRSEEQHELDREDLDLALFDGESIDLDQLVREEIVLAVPTQVLCREDCKGLCPTCGIDRNLAACECEARSVDSRWEKLKDLRF